MSRVGVLLFSLKHNEHTKLLKNKRQVKTSVLVLVHHIPKFVNEKRKYVGKKPAKAKSEFFLTRKGSKKSVCTDIKNQAICKMNFSSS